MAGTQVQSGTAVSARPGSSPGRSTRRHARVAQLLSEDGVVRSMARAATDDASARGSILTDRVLLRVWFLTALVVLLLVLFLLALV